MKVHAILCCLRVCSYNLPFHEPTPQSHRALPASGGPAGSRFWQLNVQQRSFQRTELQRSIWQHWCYSGMGTFTEMFVRIHVFSNWTYGLWQFIHRSWPFCLEGAHEPAFCKCSSCSQSSCCQDLAKTYRHLKLNTPHENLKLITQSSCLTFPWASQHLQISLQPWL